MTWHNRRHQGVCRGYADRAFQLEILAGDASLERYYGVIDAARGDDELFALGRECIAGRQAVEQSKLVRLLKGMNSAEYRCVVDAEFARGGRHRPLLCDRKHETQVVPTNPVRHCTTILHFLPMARLLCT